MENLLLRTKSRDGLYEANAIYNNGLVTVLKGSKINMLSNNGLKPDSEAAHKRSNPLIVSAEGIMLEDTTFQSLSTAAGFVTGRSANGMITWKTEDGKYVRYTLKKAEEWQITKTSPDKKKA